MIRSVCVHMLSVARRRRGTHRSGGAGIESGVSGRRRLYRRGMDEALQHGPLHARHEALGATFGGFGGWRMPVSYSGTVGRHGAARTTVGLFDVSHLGKITVRGPGALEYVNSVLTADLESIPDGAAQYTLCCTAGGGVVDDMLAYRIGPDEVF